MFSLQPDRDQDDHSSDSSNQDTATKSYSVITELLVKSADIGAMGKGKTAPIREILGLLEDITEKSGWRFKQFTFWVKGDKENILEAYNNLLRTTKIIPVVNFKSKSIKKEISRENINIEGVVFTEARVSESTDYTICAIAGSTCDLQKLHDALLVYKNNKIPRQKEILENSNGDSKSETTGPANDVILRFCWQIKKEAGGVKVQFHDRPCNSEAYRKTIENTACLRFQPNNEMVMYYPTELIRNAMDKEKNKINKARETKKQVYVLVTHPFIFSYNPSRNEFATTIQALFGTILGITPRGWFTRDDDAIYHHVDLKDKNNLKKTIKNAGLTLVEFDVSKIYSTQLVGISLIEIYLVKMFNFKCPPHLNPVFMEKKANDAATAVTVRSTVQTTSSEPTSTLSSMTKRT